MEVGRVFTNELVEVCTVEQGLSNPFPRLVFSFAMTANATVTVALLLIMMAPCFYLAICPLLSRPPGLSAIHSCAAHN